MNTVKLEGTKRAGQGRKSSQELRDSKQVPCNLYGAADANVSFALNAKDVRALIYSPEFRIAEITVDGATTKAIVKEIQSDPLSDEVTHIDFLALKEGKQVTVELPLKFVGTPKGVRDGGKLTQKIRRVKVKTTPDKLVPMLEWNIETMELGRTLRVSDIQKEGMELQHPAALPLASVFMPRVSKADEAAATKAAADTKAAAAKTAAAAPAAAAAKTAAPAKKK
jgi:large subunit ribosomal protein L25